MLLVRSDHGLAHNGFDMELCPAQDPIVSTAMYAAKEDISHGYRLLVMMVAQATPNINFHMFVERNPVQVYCI